MDMPLLIKPNGLYHQNRNGEIMSENCYMCEKGTLQRKNVDFKMYGELVGVFSAQVCTLCGETFFDEKISQTIDIATKKKGLWGLEAETKVGKSGDSLMIRVNKQLSDFLKFHKGETVKIRPEDKNKLIIEI